MRVLVVGAGGVGTAVARTVARRNLVVEGYEFAPTFSIWTRSC
jgi:prephenate dehydrogenase